MLLLRVSPGGGRRCHVIFLFGRLCMPHGKPCVSVVFEGRASAAKNAACKNNADTSSISCSACTGGVSTHLPIYRFRHCTAFLFGGRVFCLLGECSNCCSRVQTVNRRRSFFSLELYTYGWGDMPAGGTMTDCDTLNVLTRYVDLATA